MHIEQCHWKQRTGLACFRFGLWKRDPEKGRCVLCKEDENVAHSLIKYNETQKCWK